MRALAPKMRAVVQSPTAKTGIAERVTEVHDEEAVIPSAQLVRPAFQHRNADAEPNPPHSPVTADCSLVHPPQRRGSARRHRGGNRPDRERGLR
jgi:hypothetical protein